MGDSAKPWVLIPERDVAGPNCELVRQWLREHNWQANPTFMERLHQPQHEAQPLVVMASAGTRTIGGLLAETQLSWLRISIMAVDPEWRSQGIGRAMLAEAERQAISRGCRWAYADTMEYQAPRFYQRGGYQVVGEIPDWDSGGHAKLYLVKQLEALTQDDRPCR